MNTIYNLSDDGLDFGSSFINQAGEMEHVVTGNITGTKSEIVEEIRGWLDFAEKFLPEPGSDSESNIRLLIEQGNMTN